MKKITKKIYVAMFVLCHSISASAQERFEINTAHLMHNKGQVKNEKGITRHDVQFVLNSENKRVLLSAGKLEYQFSENGKWATIKMTLVNTLPNAQLIAESKSNYTENYYLNGEAVEAVPNAERICYKNIYKGVDWVLYLNKGKLEHEFVVAKGANAQQIQWTYTGADKHYIDKEGNIVLQSGENKIIEKAPQTFAHKGKKLSSKYTTQNTNYAYLLASERTDYTIDPSVEWATYHSGNNGSTFAFGATKDNNGFIYVTGVTTSTSGFASAAVHQTANGGMDDGFVSKFDTLGHHIWTTYYGGANIDRFFDIQYQNGKLYIAGQSSSSTGIATSGTQQPSLGVKPGVGPLNGILIKMDTSGKRIWGTYCGDGSSSTVFTALALDSKENVYCAGSSTEPTMVASAGSFKDTFAHSKDNLFNVSDAILVKYDSSGKRVWGTYIGDTVEDIAQTIAIHKDVVYIGGHTRSQRGIATLGSYKYTFSPFDINDKDMFLMRFDFAGNRLWGTYYGGKGIESTPHVACSKNGNIYIYGIVVNGDTALASKGAFQTAAPGGTTDCFLAKFDTACKRIWGTYVSTPNYDENGNGNGRISVEEVSDDGNVWIMGQTRGTGKGIATADAYKDSLNPSGKRDAFLGCISPLGKPIYFTYYGGEADDRAYRAFIDGQTAYLIGNTFSTTSIATAGSHKTSHSGAEQAAYIVKFAPSKPSAITDVKVQTIELQLYPNPASSFISINATSNATNNKEAVIEILNVVGKTVQTEKATIINGKLNHKLDLYQTLQAGIYQIVVVIDGQRIVKQFIKG